MQHESPKIKTRITKETKSSFIRCYYKPSGQKCKVSYWNKISNFLKYLLSARVPLK